MPCPFGYTADDEEDEEELEAQGSEAEADENAAGSEKQGEVGTGPEQVRKADKDGLDRTVIGKKANNSKDKGLQLPADLEGDPLAWFYSNQIKSEADFQVKKEEMRKLARQKLDTIMDKKNQRLMWPSDSEFDDMSISSNELSELDSDVHSLASVRSCAYSWMASASYSAPAEVSTRIAAAVGMAISALAMYVSFVGITTIKPVMGVMHHSEWVAYNFLTATGLAGAAITSLMASSWRSKRMLLMSQVLLVLTMAAALVLATMTWMMPPKLDMRMQNALCGKYGDKLFKSDTPTVCKNMPELKAQVDNSASRLQWSTTAQSIACAVQLCLGMWYILELCFIEKKGVKHTRRHRRRRFTIPWEKIQVIGKPLPCGGAAQSGAPTGKCPFAHAPVAKNKHV